MKFKPAQKNKLKMAGAIFAALVIIAAIARVIKSGAKGAQEIGKGVIDEIKSAVSFKSISWVALATFGVAYLVGGDFAAFMFGNEGATKALLLGTLASGAAAVTTLTSTYIPKQFVYTAATQLTGIKITVAGEGVIFDYDSNGLNHAGVNRCFGQVANSYVITLSNGFIANKNVTWEFTNSAAQTPSIYVSSDETPVKNGMPALYLQAIRQTVLANSGQDFSKFAALHLPSLSATDQVIALYNDGTSQQLNRVDINLELMQLQNVVTNIYTIDNYGLNVQSVNVTVGVQQTAYLQRWVAAGGGGMLTTAV